MRETEGDRPFWTEGLGHGLAAGGTDRRRAACPPEDEVRERTLLVAKVRWLLLAAFGLYGLLAGSFYCLSPYGLFLSRWQLLFLSVSLCAVVSYNTCYHLGFDRFRHLRFSSHGQILLDLLFVTLLIHISGRITSYNVCYTKLLRLFHGRGIFEATLDPLTIWV